MQRIEVAPLRFERFETVIDSVAFARLMRVLERGRTRFEQRRLWHLNSTAKGGGVAEMLHPILGYQIGAGWEAAWLVIDGDEEFFRITKRLHNHLHGRLGDGELSEDDRSSYQASLSRETAELRSTVAAGDVVVLHDPQTLGLAPALRRAGACVVWTCHVGVDDPNEVTRQAWRFLARYVDAVEAVVFSRGSYVWDDVEAERVRVIPPAIDPFSPKNRWLNPNASRDILRVAGILDDGPAGDRAFERHGPAEMVSDTRAVVAEERPVPATGPVILQVSRWDALKDHAGVLRAFAEHVRSEPRPHLVLAGPGADGVSDDPEQHAVLRQLMGARKRLHPSIRERTHIAQIPMNNLDEASVIVNALQRRAHVIVQKSLAEGFGLTVAEAMWKQRGVVAGRIGGIQDQIIDGESGVLIDDPSDLRAFGIAVAQLLRSPVVRENLGRCAHERVRERFLLSRYLVDFGELLEDVIGNDRAARSTRLRR